MRPGKPDMIAGAEEFALFGVAYKRFYLCSQLVGA